MRYLALLIFLLVPAGLQAQVTDSIPLLGIGVPASVTVDCTPQLPPQGDEASPPRIYVPFETTCEVNAFDSQGNATIADFSMGLAPANAGSIQQVNDSVFDVVFQTPGPLTLVVDAGRADLGVLIGALHPDAPASFRWVDRENGPNVAASFTEPDIELVAGTERDVLFCGYITSDPATRDLDRILAKTDSRCPDLPVTVVSARELPTVEASWSAENSDVLEVITPSRGLMRVQGYGSSPIALTTADIQIGVRVPLLELRTGHPEHMFGQLYFIGAR